MGYYFTDIVSPIGPLKLIASPKALVAIVMDENDFLEETYPHLTYDPSHLILKQSEQELAEYFSGKRRSFHVHFDLIGTDFQKKVWRAALEIPFGATCTYGDIATKIGHPKAVRAVGSAMGKNPLLILIPCHRVISASGNFANFSGCLPLKNKLLQHEQTR